MIVGVLTTCHIGTNSIIVLMFVESPVRCVINTWSVVLLNKKNIYSYLKCIVYDKLLKLRQLFRINLYFGVLSDISPSVFSNKVLYSF